MIRVDKIKFDYSPRKNVFLKKQRGISFEEISLAIAEGKVIKIVPHHNQTKYPGQKIYVVHVNDYIYLVPFVRISKTEIFLKTIIPSRKAVKKYLKKKKV